MKTYYIIVKESGEYSDYSMENIYVSDDKEKVDIKFSQINANHKPILDASIELQRFITKYNIDNPKNYTSSYDDRLSYDKIKSNLIIEITQKLAIKYNIEATLIRQSGDYYLPRFHIEEVEGD